jgi:hypothetical protein
MGVGDRFRLIFMILFIHTHQDSTKLLLLANHGGPGFRRTPMEEALRAIFFPVA